jgi:TolB protein
MHHFSKKYLWTLILSIFWFPAVSYAVTQITITKGNIDPTPLAFHSFEGDSLGAQKTGSEILEVIQNDLVNSALFRAVDPQAFIERVSDINRTPHFASWRQINASALLTARIKLLPSDMLEVHYKLWDVYTGQLAKTEAYVTPRANWRRIAHTVADDVYKQLTGEGGYFDTRIVYVSETGSVRNRIKRLAIMDQDGANHGFLATGSQLVLTPRFSPAMQQIIYLSFKDRQPHVYLRDISSGHEELLGKFQGMTYAPRFSPDGTKVAMSVAQNGNSDIYLLDLKTKKQTQLTNHPAIDVSPSFSPSGDKIVFTSTRGGKPQLYVMNADGSNPERISFGNGMYTAPVWSPRGDFIAFTKQIGNEFFIGLMRPDGSGERILTSGYLVEGPTWAPNGRVIMFTREHRPTGAHMSKRARIYSIDLTGYNEREVPTPLDASDPAWSPLLRQ